MNDSAAQCRFLITSADALFQGLDDSHRARQPGRGLKTAGWLIGHLTVTGDYGRKLCGRPPICPAEWRAAFNPGSQPSVTPQEYPSMEDLQKTFRAVYQDLCDAAVAADGAALSAPNPYTPAQAGFPTAGAFVQYLMTGHLAYHLGQLRSWRGSAGV